MPYYNCENKKGAAILIAIIIIIIIILIVITICYGFSNTNCKQNQENFQIHQPGSCGSCNTYTTTGPNKFKVCSSDNNGNCCNGHYNGFDGC